MNTVEPQSVPQPDAFDLTAFAAACQVPDPQAFSAQCELIFRALTVANQSVNLTRITDYNGFLLKHVADSLLLFQAFPELLTAKLRVGDIGCGAGFPSLILALAAPQLQITAIDSVGKKTAFVSSVAAALELRNLTVIHGRTKEMSCKKEFQQKFDLLTARAVGEIAKIYSESYPMLAQHGRFIFYKTPTQVEAELAFLRGTECKSVKMHWETTPVLTLPHDAGSRLFVYATTNGRN